MSDLTAAAGEALPIGAGRAQIVDRGAAKYTLVLLVLAALATVASLWTGAVTTKAAVIGLTCIAGTLWALLLSVRIPDIFGQRLLMIGHAACILPTLEHPGNADDASCVAGESCLKQSWHCAPCATSQQPCRHMD